jgi:hypothetical protein
VLLDMTAPPVMETLCKPHHRMGGMDQGNDYANDND